MDRRYHIAAIVAFTLLLAAVIVAIICAIVFTSNTQSNSIYYAHYYPIDVPEDIFSRDSSPIESTTTPVSFDEHKEWIPAWEAARQRARGSSYRGVPVDYLAAVILYTDRRIAFAQELNQSIRKGTLLDSRTLLDLYRLLVRGLKMMRESDPQCHQSVYEAIDGSIIANVGTSVCLGQFHMASLGKPTLTLRADQSSLVFDTCYGVLLQNISTSSLQTVLIPPYERFQFTRNDGRAHYLNSVGECSVSNCAVGTGITNPCPVLQVTTEDS